MDLGLVTFADLYPGVSAEERMRDLLEEARLADELGLKVFAVGEHHRPDFAVSSPAVVLAAAAERSSRIRLTKEACGSWRRGLQHGQREGEREDRRRHDQRSPEMRTFVLTSGWR